MGLLRKAIRAALYTGVIGLVVAWSVVGPKHQVLAQQAGTNVPAAYTGHAIPAPIHDGVTPGQPGPVNRPLLSADPVALQKAKTAANDRAAAAQGGPGAKSPSGPYGVYNNTNFAGIAATGCCTPPDSTGAIGPYQYVEMVNSNAEMRTRAGVSFATNDLGDFGAFDAHNCTFDPQITWDQQGGRFIYSFLEQTCDGLTNYVDFGWSTTNNPSDLFPSHWCRYVLGTGPYLFDYDKLGHDNNFINIGANAFLGNNFQTAVIISINKPAPGSTSCPAFPTFTGFGTPTTPLLTGSGAMAFTPVPAVTTDSFAAGYVVAASNAVGSTKITMWHVTSSGGSPVLSLDGDVTVASYDPPPNVPQPGTVSCSTSGNCLDSLDGRITQAVAHYDPDVGGEAVWTQHAVHDGTVNALSVERWYEFTPGHGTGLRQTGNVSDSSLYIFNGAISPSMAGNEAVIFYNAGNATAVTGLASFRAQSRNSATTLHTMANETILATSAAADNDFSCGVNRMPAVLAAPCRWGDYSAARPDPLDANAVWGTNMLSGVPNVNNASWVTQVAAYTPGCATASVLGAAATAHTGDMVTFTASSTGCSSPKYQFWLGYPNGSWAVKQAFSSANVWNFDTAGYPLGDYSIHVWANQSGDSPASWEAVGAVAFHLSAPVPCSSPTLSPPTPTAEAGGTINFMATASGCSTPVFEYWLQDPSGTWTMTRPFGTDPNWSWVTTGLVPGTYHVHVWANQRGDSYASFEASAASTVTLTGCTTASIAPPSVAQPAGTTVNLTASSGGCSTPQYEFWIGYPNGTFVKGRTWGVAAWAWDTTGLAPGMYSVHVWANETGASTVTWEANGVASVALNICTSAALSPTNPNAPAGAIVNLTASSTGCTQPYYEFWVGYPDGSWHNFQGFSAMTTFAWHTAGLAPGTYSVHVWANDLGDSFATFEANGSDTVTLTGCTAAAISPPSVAQPAGTTVHLTASSAACASPQYSWWVQYTDGSWHNPQGFGASSNTFNWSTTGLPAGMYSVHVWVNNLGDPQATWESNGAASVALSICTSAALAPTNPSTPAGTKVTLTASSTGCTQPYYEFWVQYTDGSWHMLQGFTTLATFDFNTAGFAPGAYNVHVWANNKGDSFATFEANGSDTVTVTGCATASLVPPSGTFAVGTKIPFTASSTGGCPTPVYEFWLQYPNGTWHLMQGFSPGGATWTWDTAALPKGNYVIHVWANNANSDLTAPEAYGTATITLN